MTTVDLVVPAYAPASVLAELVAGVRAQSDPSWTLTLVDDAHPDPGLEAWARTLDDDRIRYVRNPENLGLSRNFNHCLSFARAPLVTVVGSDDLLLPGYVATVRDTFRRHPDATMIQPGVEVVDGDGRPTTSLADLVKKHIYAPRGRDEVSLSGEALAVSLLRGNWLYFPSICWRTEAVRQVGFREDLHTLLDLATEIELAEAGATLVTTPTICFRYRRHRDSVSAWRARDGSRFAEERAFFGAVAQRMADRGWRRAERAARRHVSSRLNALSLVPGAVTAGSGAQARALLGHALRPGATGPRNVARR